jgi:hypothetical protein
MLNKGRKSLTTMVGLCVMINMAGEIDATQSARIESGSGEGRICETSS